MRMGAHVSSAGGLLRALGRGAEIGADVIQIFVQSPRAFKVVKHPDERLAAYREAQLADKKVRATYAHAPYLINLASENRELAELSTSSLTHNLVTTTAIGGAGVVLHVGSHLGNGIDGAIGQIVEMLRSALDRACDESGGEICPLLLENAAGSGGTIGRNFDELARLIDASAGDARLGTCLDTQHLFASGISFATREEADDVVAHADATFGLARLGLIHLNDSKVDFGSNRDRHANLGEGAIGLRSLGALLSHPRLADVPAVLEVPGSGDGPRGEDVGLARDLVRKGIASRRRATKRVS